MLLSFSQSSQSPQRNAAVAVFSLRFAVAVLLGCCGNAVAAPVEVSIVGRAPRPPLELLQELVTDEKSGEARTIESLERDGRLLVFVSPECSSCERYIRDLESCSQDVRQRLAWVMVRAAAGGVANSTSHFRALARLQRDPMAVVWVANRAENVGRWVRATPTTLIHERLRVGVLSCSDLTAKAPGI